MTGFTYDAQRFDNWIIANYCTLQKHCKRYRIDEDELNDTYLNVKKRILLSGYTGSQYMTFMKRSLRNLQINKRKKLNGRFYVDIENEDYINTIENTLQNIDETEKDTQQYREDVLFLSKKIFQYINEKSYNSEWQFVFRCYFIMNGRMTYAKLTQMTGINKNLNTKIIQTMKNDIRTGFLSWLKKQNKEDE